MLIGRAQELEAIEGAVSSSRLVTLVGPGGVGKTALAVEFMAAWRAGEAFLADLTGLSGDDIKENVAGSLRFSSFGELIDAIGETQALVVIDNCEHVIDAAAALTEDLLEMGPACRIVATSRIPLSTAEERVLPIEPLSVEGDPPPAVEMYLAERQRRGLTADADVASTAALCRRLDGLPLAMALAAARAIAMTEAEILEDLDIRLDLLSRTRARGSDRHGSLSAAIAWSYNLLEPSERQLFARLAVFPAPFTVDLAARVLGLAATELVEHLFELVQQSLLVHGSDGGVSTYRMLDTIRLYAAERLDRADETTELEERLVDAIADHATDIAAQADRAMASVPLALGRLYRTMQWALDRCVRVDAEPDRCARIIFPLWWLEDVGHQAEAADAVERVVAKWPSSPLLSQAKGVLAGLHRYAGHRSESERAAQMAIDSEDAFAAALAYRALGQYARTDGNWELARERFASGKAAALAAGKPALALEIELHDAITTARGGDVHSGAKQAEQLMREAGDFPLVDAVARAFLAWLLLAIDPSRAWREAEFALDQAQKMRYRWGAGSANMTLAGSALIAGDLEAAATHAAAAIEDFGVIRDRTGVTLALLEAAAVLSRVGLDREAAQAAATRRQFVSGHLGDFEQALFDRIGVPEPDGSRLPPVALRTVVEYLHDIGRHAEPGDPDSGNVFVLAGGMCAIRFDGREIRQRASKGLRDLATLLRAPGKEVAALDLMGAAVVSGDQLPPLDAVARSRYEERVRELQADIEEAEGFGDTERAASARAEIDQIALELSRAYGIGGRARSTGHPAERARSAVTHRIKDAIKKIEASDPNLADHLRRSIRTGTFCSYNPVSPVAWTVEMSGD